MTMKTLSKILTGIVLCALAAPPSAGQDTPTVTINNASNSDNPLVVTFNVMFTFNGAVSDPIEIRYKTIGEEGGCLAGRPVEYKEGAEYTREKDGIIIDLLSPSNPMEPDTLTFDVSVCTDNNKNGGSFKVVLTPPHHGIKIQYDDNRDYAIGTINDSHTSTEKEELPGGIALGQNYPNPFNAATTIEYSSIDAASHVSLVVYDMTGKQVGMLVDGIQQQGAHQVTFDATGLPTGTYLYVLRTENNPAVMKPMTLLK